MKDIVTAISGKLNLQSVFRQQFLHFSHTKHIHLHLRILPQSFVPFMASLLRCCKSVTSPCTAESFQVWFFRCNHSTSGSCVWVLTVPPQVKKPPCPSLHWEPLWFFSDVFLLLSLLVPSLALQFYQAFTSKLLGMHSHGTIKCRKAQPLIGRHACDHVRQN